MKTKIAAKNILTSKLSPNTVSRTDIRMLTKKPETNILMLKLFLTIAFIAPIMLSSAATIAIAKYFVNS